MALLAAHRVQSDDAALEPQGVEQLGDGRDLVRLAVDRALAERQSPIARPGADRMQRAVLAVETIRSLTGTYKVEAEIRYFLTSCGDDPAVLARAIRRHWSVENGLHWVLDVVFREDRSRIRAENAGANLAMIRRVAVSLLRRAPGKGSGVTKRLKAGWDDDYLLQVLQGITADAVR